MTTTHVDLALEGMTCATCAGRIEGALRTVPGVTASVNFATERASVDIDGVVDATALITAIEKVGYGAREITDTGVREPESPVDRLLLWRVIAGIALAIPVLAISMIPDLQFDGYQWALAALTTPIATWVAWPFHRAAWKNLRHGATTMDTLVSLGVAVAYVWSLYAVAFTHAGMIGMRMEMSLFGDSTHALYFESAAAVTAFVLLGRYVEARSKRTARQSLTALLDVAAKDAILLIDGREVTLPAGAIQVGDRFVALAGAIIATDGIVIEGSSTVDASSVTGESMPVPVSPGTRVTGGTINAGGRLVIEATAVGSATELARLTKMVEAAQAAKAPVQKLVDRVSAVFVPLVIVLAVGAGVWWYWQSADVTKAIAVAVATLVVACPCALGLATPMALLVGTGRGARSGIVIRGTDVLESTRRIDTIVFDKTGTLTAGRPAVVGVTGDGLDDTIVISDAARVDVGTDHPIARAIVAEATARGLDIPAAADIVAVPGHGVVGMLGGTKARVGTLAWALAEGATVADDVRDTIDGWIQVGYTVSVLTHDDRIVGAIAVSDPVRPSSAAAVAHLKELGLHTVLASGDSEIVAQRIGTEVGVDEIRAPMTPADKRDLIAALQTEGRTVAMVGDGINDAAALAQADCGIAMGGGTDVAIEASDIVIVSADVRRVADAIRLSRSTLGTIRGNLVWAFGYNALAIPVAMLGIVGPAIAGIAMAFSSVFVVLNSGRLALFRLRR
ncbi:MAG: hypothetical protein RLZZ40_829 [Actinomycetota bacterium]